MSIHNPGATHRVRETHDSYVVIMDRGLFCGPLCRQRTRRVESTECPWSVRRRGSLDPE